MISNASITIFNKYVDKETRLEKWQKTFIDKVFWQEKQAYNQFVRGFVEADYVLALIPFINSFSRQYLSPIEFKKEKSKESYFTIQEGDFIVKGKLEDEITSGDIKRLRKDYEIYTVSSIDINDFGRKHMQHFKVGAK